MKEILRTKINLIIAKYEKLGLDTPVYKDLKRLVADEKWLADTAMIMSKVANSDKIFNISKEVNTQKNDQRVDEAFAEFDTARNIATTRFYGTFDTVTYLPEAKDRRWPDFVAQNADGPTPVEVKLLTPLDLSETKFFQKFVDKVNDHALPQLASYYQQNPFEKGFIFVWSYHPVQLQNLQYNDLEKWLKAQVPKQQFDLVVLCNLYGRGMWDFHI